METEDNSGAGPSAAGLSEREAAFFDEALALHHSGPVVDLHADPLLWSRLAGYDLLRRHRNRLPRSPFWSHSDLPRWREAGVDLVLTGIVTFPSALPGPRAFRQACRTIERARDFEGASSGGFAIIEDLAGFDAAFETPAKVGGLLALEGAHALHGDLNHLEELRKRGLRSVGLAHFHRNDAVSPSWGPGGDSGPLASRRRANRGLSDFGRELVGALNANQLAVDLAHVGRAGFLEAAALSRQPVFVSHTGVRGGQDHWRNIDDEQIRVVAEQGGVVGLIFAGLYLGGNRIADVVRHIEHVIEIGGEDCPALGSDFDGMIIPVKGLDEASSLPRLSAALLARGHLPERVAKIIGGNAKRYLGEVLGGKTLPTEGAEE